MEYFSTVSEFFLGGSQKTTEQMRKEIERETRTSNRKNVREKEEVEMKMKNITSRLKRGIDNKLLDEEAQLSLAQQLIELKKKKMQLEGQSFGRMLQEPAAKEAFTAFMQKRKPDFSKV